MVLGLRERPHLELERLDVKRNLPLCLIMADVNGLKLINDSFGHQTGDELLIKVGSVLKRPAVQMKSSLGLAATNSSSFCPIWKTIRPKI